MKIALVCDWYLPRRGGIEHQVSDLARELAKRGHDVDVITSTPGEDPDTDFKVIRIEAPLLPVYSTVCTFKPLRSIRELLRDGGYDLVHCHYSYISPLATVAAHYCSQSGMPTVVSFHSLLGRLAAVLKILSRWVEWHKWPVVFTCVSNKLAKEFRSMKLGLDPVVLPNGIDIADRFSRSRKPEADRFHAISVIRMCPRKRPLELVKIIARAKAIMPAGSNFTATIVGGGRMLGAVSKLVRQLGLENTVILLGEQPREQIPSLLADADIFVLPSQMESFGIAALEAIGTGLPVVALRESGASELIEHGRNGFLMADDEELAEQLPLMAGDLELRERLWKYGPQIPSGLSWQEIMTKQLEIYKDATAMIAGNNSCAAREGSQA